MLETNTDSHPWASARDHFNNSVLPRLRQHGKAIGEAAETGDDNAKQIMAHYQMLHRSFDPMTLTMLDESLTSYLAKTAISDRATLNPNQPEGVNQVLPAARMRI